LAGAAGFCASAAGFSSPAAGAAAFAPAAEAAGAAVAAGPQAAKTIPKMMTAEKPTNSFLDIFLLQKFFLTQTKSTHHRTSFPLAPPP
jgi:hypothetical protein